MSLYKNRIKKQLVVYKINGLYHQFIIEVPKEMNENIPGLFEKNIEKIAEQYKEQTGEDFRRILQEISEENYRLIYGGIDYE